MTVIVQIPQGGSWQVANAGFRILTDGATRDLSARDQEVLVRAQALGLLQLDELELDQAQSIAAALRRSAHTLRLGLRNSSDAWEQLLADAFDDLAMRLTDLAGETKL